MASFVLIHGGFHGGWCWQRLTPHLWAAGHTVYTPTLTGLGERAHLGNPTVGLETHIQDILNLLTYEDLHSVVLVGHSWGGWVLPSIADRARERIAHLVYIDAGIPSQGETAIGRLGAWNADVRAEWEERVRREGDGWRLPVPYGVLDFLGITAPEDIQWVGERLTPHPFKFAQDPVQLSERACNIPSTFIACIGANLPGREPPPDAAGMRYREIPTGHDAMLTMPQELARLLVEVA